MADSISRKSRTRKIRRIVQIFFFALIAAIAVLNGLKESGIEVPFGGEASLHAVCPFGGVVTFWTLVTQGTFVKKAHESSVVLAVLGIILAVFAGPVICGWMCPFGTFQEWIAGIGRKITGKKYNTFVPARIDRILRYLRYLLLVWVSYMTVMTGKLSFEAIDPYYALFNFWRSEVAVGGLVVLAAVVLLSLFVERPFCKYACPYGAFQGLFNFVRVFAIRRNEPTCVGCKACTRACPMNIEVERAKTVRNHQCISCLECTSDAACPKEATVTLSGPGGKPVLRALPLAVIAVAVLFGGIALSVFLGRWNVSSSKIPATIRSGDFVGQPNPSDIRGSYTWDDVSNAFAVPVDALVQAFGAESSTARVNALETVWAGKLAEGTEVGTDSVRIFVSLYTGLPHTPEEGSVLPLTAVNVLEKAGKSVPVHIRDSAVSPDSASITTPVTESSGNSASVISPVAIAITGKTTFRELENAGYDMEKVEVLTGKFTDPDEAIRDFCLRSGIEFSAVKEGLSAP